ncbi:hypothetical protein IQ225_10125 [Synechocystis salina LEGE 06155]|nr:hypothetical protein [Synechocystis salina LEGE 06155]
MAQRMIVQRITALVSLVISSSLFWGGFGEPASAQASCQDTLDAVATEMRKKGTSVKIDILPLGFEDEHILNNIIRIGYLQFVLGAQSVRHQNPAVYDRQANMARNIINSPVLLRGYANGIFANCGGTGYVNFRLDQTDWDYELLMTDDGIFYQPCDDNPENIIDRISNPVVGEEGYEHCAYVITDF